MPERTFGFKLKTDDPLYKKLTEDITNSGKNTQPFLIDLLKAHYSIGESGEAPKDATLAQEPSTLPLRNETSLPLELECEYATSIGSKIYCDNDKKKTVPKDRLLPLRVCVKCFNRREAEEDEYTKKTLGLKHEEIKQSQKPVETPQPYSWDRTKTQEYEDTHIACPDKSDPTNGIKHYVEPKECATCLKSNTCKALDEFALKHPNYNPNPSPNPSSSTPHVYYKAKDDFDRKTPRSGR